VGRKDRLVRPVWEEEKGKGRTPYLNPLTMTEETEWFVKDHCSLFS
jgi:hypothetical protein